MTRASLTLSLSLALAEEELQAVLADLRTEGWREGSIYIFITGYDGTSFFHGANPAREGTNNYDQADANGVKIIQELIKAARRVPQGELCRSHRDPGGQLLHRRRVVSG